MNYFILTLWFHSGFVCHVHARKAKQRAWDTVGTWVCEGSQVTLIDWACCKGAKLRTDVFTIDTDTDTCLELTFKCQCL